MPRKKKDAKFGKAEFLARIDQWETESERLRDEWMKEPDYEPQVETDESETAYWEGYTNACARIKALAEELPDDQP